MNPKLIAIDLDRTLLHTDKTISAYSANILNKCRENRYKIVFATARPKRAVVDYMESIPVDAVILHNGAVVYIGDELVASYGIEPTLKDEILKSIYKDYPKITLSVEIDDVLYANFDVSTVWNNTEAIQSDFTYLPNRPADKIIIGLTPTEGIEIFSRYLTDDLYIEMVDGKLGLIMNRKATKWEAIKTVAQHFSISTNEIIAFGDDFNDIFMLKGCGFGIAVTNAIDEVKAVADFICDSNDNDGVAKWLDEHLL